METLAQAIQTTPIIDHHAHNLLLPDEIDAHDLLSITSEAQGTCSQSISAFRCVRLLWVYTKVWS